MRADELRRRLAAWAERSIPSHRDAPVVVLAAALAAALFLLSFGQTLATVPLPLTAWDGHSWRQSFTFGVAWNFAHTRLDVLRPRMFVELGGTNTVPMEAPLYPLLTSFLFRILGDTVVAPRLFSILGLAATAVVLLRWLADERDGPRGALADRAGLLVALALSPMLVVESRSIQPEPAAAGLAAVSAACLVRYANEERGKDLVRGAAAFGLSLLMKPYALAIAPALVLFAAWPGARVGSPWRRAAAAAAALAIAAVPWAAWDRWAHHLLATELDGNWVIEIGHPPRALLASIRSGLYTREVILNQLAGYAVSWWLVPAVLVGIHRGLAERRRRRYAVPLLAWLGGTTILLLAVGIRLASNAYYVILAGAPLAYFAALGLGAVIRLLDASRAWPAGVVARTGILCAFLLALGASLSHGSAASSPTDVAQFGLFRNREVWGSDIGLARLALVLAIGLAIAPLARLRTVPTWAGLVGVLLLVPLAIRPARDAAQYLRYYAATERRAGFDAELGALRAAVARHAGPRDLVLLSPGGDHRQPTLIYYEYALRNGLPARAPIDLDALRARGVRVYLEVDQTGPVAHPRVDGRVLAEGAWWRLRCVAADGCP